jgi:hypothetical protein
MSSQHVVMMEPATSVSTPMKRNKSSLELVLQCGCGSATKHDVCPAKMPSK